MLVCSKPFHYPGVHIAESCVPLATHQLNDESCVSGIETHCESLLSPKFHKVSYWRDFVHNLARKVAKEAFILWSYRVQQGILQRSTKEERDSA